MVRPQADFSHNENKTSGHSKNCVTVDVVCCALQLGVLLCGICAVLLVPSSELQPRGSIVSLNVSCVVGNKMSLFVDSASSSESWDLGLIQRADGGLLYAE